MSAKRASRDPKRGKRTARGGRAAVRRRIPWLYIGMAAVAITVGFFVYRSFGVGAPGEHIAASGVGVHPSEGTAVAYNSVPSVGGPHWPTPASWGVSGVPVPEERATHNLEHGGVVVSYNGISDTDLSKLKALLTSYPRDKYNEVKMLIRPFDRIPSGTFVLTAWEWKQSFSSYDDAALRLFLDSHLNRCCESVP